LAPQPHAFNRKFTPMIIAFSEAHAQLNAQYRQSIPRVCQRCKKDDRLHVCVGKALEYSELRCDRCRRHVAWLGRAVVYDNAMGYLMRFGPHASEELGTLSREALCDLLHTRNVPPSICARARLLLEMRPIHCGVNAYEDTGKAASVPLKRPISTTTTPRAGETTTTPRKGYSGPAITEMKGRGPR
jgi:hypothetical protein